MSKFEESNFYKALQDFFINADKKTFLQFLAEFYNRTEGIIDKNNIQADLIKESRELYLEFNEKGIDENIVREKVNYFLENSVKIKDIITKLTTNTNNIENITSQLDTKANQSDVFKRTNYRYFKPNFGYNVMWGETTDTNGGYVSKNNIERGNDIKLCERLHIDEITLALFIGYNSNTDTLYSTVNISDVKETMEYYKDYNVKIKTVKIHFGGISERYLFDTITFEKFDRLYQEFLKQICQQYKNTTVENITVLNEFFSIDNNPAYTSSVVNWLNIVKSYGYKTGITCAGVERAYLVQPEIHQNSDLICVNCDPKISFI